METTARFFLKVEKLDISGHSSGSGSKSKVKQESIEQVEVPEPEFLAPKTNRKKLPPGFEFVLMVSRVVYFSISNSKILETTVRFLLSLLFFLKVEKLDISGQL